MSAADVSLEKKKKKKKKFVREESSSEEEAPQPSKASTSYEPPNGYKPLSSDPECSHFDWDTVNSDPNLEIWAIRLPSNLKPKYLDKMSFPLPQDGTVVGPIARITAGKKQTEYELTVASESAGAEEMKRLDCLLPRKSKGGKLFMVTKPFAGHLVISEAVVSPTSPNSSTNVVNPLPMPNSTRYAHPPHLLKHRFVPTSVTREVGKAKGASDAEDEENASMIDVRNTHPSSPQSPPRPHKKRKAETDGTEEKKSKKHKKEK